ncbi:MAG: hypothetical protein WCJ80_08150 [Bacteroidota bacterium]
MYKLSKYLLVCIVILFSATNSSAQFKLPHLQLVGMGVYSIPTNTAFKDGYKNGLGVEAGAGIGLGSTMIMGTAGYEAYSNYVLNTAGNLKVTSIKAGIRQYIFLGHLFLLGNMGTAIQSYSNNSATASNFIYEYGAGIRLIGLELQVTQTHWEQPLPVSSNSFNVKLGFSFKL